VTNTYIDLLLVSGERHFGMQTPWFLTMLL